MQKRKLQYGTSTIKYSLEFAERKTLGIRVHPDNSVQVIAPTDSSEEKINQKVKEKAAWILKQQDFFISFRPLTPPRKFISGETHLYLGRQYRLKVVKADQSSVKLQAGNIIINVPSKSDTKQIEKLLKAWYKEKAIQHFTKLFEANLYLIKKYYKGTPTLNYRWMKKRWGSCNQNGQINLNLELIKAPKRCIEYVIIHEFCHLVHLNHSTAFYTLLKKLFPNWQATKDRLERVMV